MSDQIKLKEHKGQVPLELSLKCLPWDCCHRIRVAWASSQHEHSMLDHYTCKLKYPRQSISINKVDVAWHFMAQPRKSHNVLCFILLIIAVILPKFKVKRHHSTSKWKSTKELGIMFEKHQNLVSVHELFTFLLHAKYLHPFTRPCKRLISLQYHQAEAQFLESQSNILNQVQV